MRTHMPMLKLEISIPEIKKAVFAFKENRKKAMEALSLEIRDKIGSTMNQMMSAEIELFLGTPDQVDNKRNGYHPEREYAIKGIGCIRIKTPKDRKGRFESQIIPKHERVDPRIKADMIFSFKKTSSCIFQLPSW